MSTLVAQTLSNGTVSTSTANCIQGSAKAWVVFDGTGPTIRTSFNVSSVTRQATGQFTINMTNAMVDKNYVVCGSLVNGTTPGVDGLATVGGNDQAGSTPGSQTTSSFTIGTFTYPTTFKNFTYTNILVLR